MLYLPDGLPLPVLANFALPGISDLAHGGGTMLVLDFPAGLLQSAVNLPRPFR